MTKKKIFYAIVNANDCNKKLVTVPPSALAWVEFAF